MLAKPDPIKSIFAKRTRETTNKQRRTANAPPPNRQQTAKTRRSGPISAMEVMKIWPNDQPVKAFSVLAEPEVRLRLPDFRLPDFLTSSGSLFRATGAPKPMPIHRKAF